MTKLNNTPELSDSTKPAIAYSTCVCAFNFFDMSNKSTYKVLDLFGNEEIKFVEKDNSKPSLFDNYDGLQGRIRSRKTRNR